jgi:hypothetical protein
MRISQRFAGGVYRGACERGAGSRPSSVHLKISGDFAGADERYATRSEWQSERTTRALFRLGRCAGNLCIQSRNGGVKARWNYLGVMLQSSLGIGMPEVALHVFHGRVILHVRG